MGWGYGMFGGFGMIIFWGFLILLVFFLGRALVANKPTTENGDEEPRPSRALEILQERFAKGEITKEEYEERRKTLTE